MALRVLVAMGDDDTRRALPGLLRQAGGLEVVGEAANDALAIALTVSARPDVVVLDRELPTMGGIEALTHTLKRESGAQVIIRGGERPPWSDGSRFPEGTVWVSGQAPQTELTQDGHFEKIGVGKGLPIQQLQQSYVKSDIAVRRIDDVPITRRAFG